MSRLEDELRNALRREEPPEGFAARVLARAAATPEPRRARAWTRVTRWFRAPVFARAAMAGALCLVVRAGCALRAEATGSSGCAARPPSGSFC